MFCLQLISVSRLCAGSRRNVHQTSIAQRLYDRRKGKHSSHVYVVQLSIASVCVFFENKLHCLILFYFFVYRM